MRFVRLLPLLCPLVLAGVALLRPQCATREWLVDPTPAEDPAMVAVTAAEGHLVVRHAAGVCRVPRRVTRVAALAFADDLLCLGITPVAVQTDTDGGSADYLRDRLRGVAAVRTMPGTGTPDLEALVRARPQLILTAAIDRRLVEQLEWIAPTVVLRPATTMYRENGSIDAIVARLHDLAAVLEREAEAAAFVAGFRARLRSLREVVQARAAGRSVAFFRTHGREWRLYGHRGGFGGEAVFAELGVVEPRGLGGGGTTALDPERLLGFDCDFLIVVADPSPGAAQGLMRIRRHPSWQRIAAVRAGRVYEIDVHRHWVLSGPLGKLRMAEDIAAAVAL